MQWVRQISVEIVPKLPPKRHCRFKMAFCCLFDALIASSTNGTFWYWFGTDCVYLGAIYIVRFYCSNSRTSGISIESVRVSQLPRTCKNPVGKRLLSSATLVVGASSLVFVVVCSLAPSIDQSNGTSRRLAIIRVHSSAESRGTFTLEEK